MPSDPSRRRLLTVLVGAGAGAAFGVAAVPAALLAAAPAEGGGGESPWVPLAKFDELAEGQPYRVKLIADQVDGYAVAKQQPLGLVWLVRKGSEVHALSATCPHLGCTVDLGPDGKHFFCPCHSSTFDFDGQRTAGKPNKALRGMDALPARITGRQVEVQFKRFQMGTDKSEALG